MEAIEFVKQPNWGSAS